MHLLHPEALRSHMPGTSHDLWKGLSATAKQAIVTRDYNAGDMLAKLHTGSAEAGINKEEMSVLLVLLQGHVNILCWLLNQLAKQWTPVYKVVNGLPSTCRHEIAPSIRLP